MFYEKTHHIYSMSETHFAPSFLLDHEMPTLSEAVFTLPFYVQETADSDGTYIYAGTAPDMV